MISPLRVGISSRPQLVELHLLLCGPVRQLAALQVDRLRKQLHSSCSLLCVSMTELIVWKLKPGECVVGLLLHRNSQTMYPPFRTCDIATGEKPALMRRVSHNEQARQCCKIVLRTYTSQCDLANSCEMRSFCMIGKAAEQYEDLNQGSRERGSIQTPATPRIVINLSNAIYH